MKYYFIRKLERLMVSLHRKELTNLFLLTKIYSKDRDYRMVPANKKWKVWRRDQFKCVYCGLDEGLMTIDHIVPRAAGGTDRYENLCTSCMKCNNAKGSRTAEEFINSSWLEKRKKKIQKNHTSTTRKKQSMMSQPKDGNLWTFKTTGESSLSTTIAQEAISGP